MSGIIDRPLGSTHPHYPDIVYPVNYGYIEGVIAGDGEEQDVYVLGTDEPLKTFEGTVIAVYHRLNDNENKWIVAVNDRNILMMKSFMQSIFRNSILRGY